MQRYAIPTLLILYVYKYLTIKADGHQGNLKDVVLFLVISQRRRDDCITVKIVSLF